ncbi:MAG: tetratricopeptide repeat protein [Minisyncoccia bacterium]
MPPQSTVPQRRSIETVSVFALIATVVIAVFAITPSVATSLMVTKTFLLAVGAIITLALYILARLTRGNVIFPSSALVGVLWLPAVAYIASSAFSGIPFMSAFWGTSFEPDTLGFMLVAAVLGTLSTLVLRRVEHYRSFLRAGAYAFSVIVLLEALAIAVGQFSPGTISPNFSVLGSFEDLAFLLGLGVIITLITLRFLDLSSRVRRVLIVSSVVALFLLAIANVVSVWILIAIVSLGLFVETIMRRGPGSSDSDIVGTTVFDEAPLETDEGNQSIILPLIVLAVSMFFLISGTLGGALASAFHVNILNVRPSWQSTFAVAQKAYSTSSVFGSGPSTFGSEWLKYRDASLNSTVFWNVDFTSGIGFIPTSFVTTGIVGALAWLAFLGSFIVLGLRTLLMRAPRDAFVRYAAIISFIGSLYLFTVAVFNVPNAVILALAFVFAGVFVSTTRYATDGKQWGIVFSRSPRIGFVIVFSLTILLLSSVVAAYTLVEHYIAATELASATTAFSAGDLDKAERFAKNSISFAPSAGAYQIQANVARARLNLIISSTTTDKATAQREYQAALSSGINAAMTAANLNASDYQNWLTLGSLYAQAVPLGVSGAYDSAKTAYGKAVALNPTNPQIHYIVAQLNIANKNSKAAQDDLKAAIMLKQDYTDAIFLLSQLEVQEGNVKDALTTALAAAYFTPNNPAILFQVGVLYAAQGDFTNAILALSSAINANPQFANARYFLSAVYAKLGDTEDALIQMKAIAAMSNENAQAVVSQLKALEAGKNPFPANLLSVSPPPVKQ